MAVKLYIITGERGSGKTRLLAEFANYAISEGIFAAGIYTTAIELDGERNGYMLNDIRSGKRRLLCTTEEETKITSGKYFFYDGAIEFGRNCLYEAEDADLIIVDEAGPLELKGGGWYPSLKKIFEKNSKKALFISIRFGLIENFCDEFGIKPERIFNTSDTDLIQEMEQILHGYRR